VCISAASLQTSRAQGQQSLWTCWQGWAAGWYIPGGKTGSDHFAIIEVGL